LHVDLGDIRSVLRDHPDAIVECRIAFALYLDPDQQGMRALERSAGVAFNSVLETLSAHAWGLSAHGLVQTVERGKSWDSDGREVSIYRLAESVRERVTSSYTSKSPSISVGMKGWNSYVDGDSLAHRLAVMDPALDIWSRKKTELGPEGWRIAVLTGLESVELSAKEWAELAGGTDRAKRLAKKFESFGCGILLRTGKARATRYRLDWTWFLDDRFDPMNLRIREGNLLRQHAEEQIRITQPQRPNHGPALADALLAELDGTETAEHREGIERLAELWRTSTAEDWARWADPLSV
jgi:hypothetical protein